jgi:hypothetical protein
MSAPRLGPHDGLEAAAPAVTLAGVVVTAWGLEATGKPDIRANPSRQVSG